MGRVRLTRPFVLLALAALLAPPAEASRTSVWERNPPASLKATTPDAAGLLASLAPAAAADTEIAEPALFNLGDVVLADTADADAEHFDLGPLTLVDLNHLRGPPPSYPETRVRGFELLPPFRVGPSPSLSLWSRQACGSISCELVSDSPEDPWGLETGAAFGAIDRRDRGITNPIAGTIDPEAVAREAAATAVEEFSYVGIANGLSSSLLGYDFVRNEEVKGPLARVLAAVSVVPGIPATVRRIDEIPGLNSVAKAASEGAEEATKAARGAVICGSGGPCKVYEIPAAELTTGKPYIGKTRRSIPQRMADKDHRLKTPTGKPPKAEPLAENLTPEEAAGVEALLAQERGLENLSNKIPPLDPTLPKNAPRIEAARKLLERERGQ